MPLPITFSQVMRRCAALALCLVTLAGSIASAPTASATAANGTPAPTGAELLTSFEGLESAIARQYELPDKTYATPESAHPTMTSAYVFIFQFDTEANAEQVWELTDSIPGTDDASGLVATPLPGVGDKATLFLPSASADIAMTEGMLFIREGTTAIVVSGEGHGPSAALGERLQEMATFVLAHPSSPDPITVTYDGDGSGGDFSRMPGLDEADLLQGLIPRWDYDLLAEIAPVDPTATPVAPCSCLPPATATA